MSQTVSSSEKISPLLQVLQQQIVPWAREKGMENVIVAAPSWKKFQQIDAPLPDGAFVTRQPLKSKKTTVKYKIKSRGSTQSLVDAQWMEDGLHSTTAPVLCFVLAGAVALPLGDYVAHCLPGHAILMPAGTPRPAGENLCLDESRANGGYCSMLSFMPWAGGVQCWINHTQIDGHQSQRTPREYCDVLHPQASQYLESLAEEAVARSPEYLLHCNGLLSALIAVLVREIRQKRAFPLTSLGEVILDPAVREKMQQQNSISRAQFYIASHLHESLTIDEVASHVYMSRAYFTRRFRQATGKSFVEYLTESRWEKAKVLLENTNWSLRRIAAEIGISPGRLRDIFLNFELQTPAQFRRANRG
jgi:AraC-like DNA-binding protein